MKFTPGEYRNLTSPGVNFDIYIHPGWILISSVPDLVIFQNTHPYIKYPNLMPQVSKFQYTPRVNFFSLSVFFLVFYLVFSGQFLTSRKEMSLSNMLFLSLGTPNQVHMTQYEMVKRVQQMRHSTQEPEVHTPSKFVLTSSTLLVSHQHLIFF